MSNHVHVLVTPLVDGKQWLGPLKGFTAHEANRILGRTGRFWQDESYDRLVRDDTEFGRVLRYIENNPVAAGMCASPEEFSWSSAAPGRSPSAG
jgi:putative DNA methylase